MFLFPQIQGKLVKSKSGILSQNTLVSRRSIMAAILQTIGPVSTCQAIRANWAFLRSTTSTQFHSAAAELEKLNLGRCLTMSNKGRNSHVFLKKPPEEVKSALEANMDLCAPDVYAMRYHRPGSQRVSQAAKAKLIEMGLVRQDQFM